MRMFWNRGDRELARRLRASRPEPRDELVATIADSVERTNRARPRAWSRVAFGMAVLVFMLGSFGSFGGLSYAASGVAGTVKAVKEVAKEGRIDRAKTSAGDNYGPVTPRPKPEVTPKPPTTRDVVRPGGNLPFTGLPLIITALIGSSLLGAGAALRRRERPRD